MLIRSSLVLACVLFVAAPVQAQERDGIEEGLDLFSEGARRFIEEFAGELGPLLLQLEALMDEITAYQAPEILENGDIIIRRKPETPDPDSPADPEADTDAPIDL